MKHILLFCLALLCLSSCRKEEEDPLIQLPATEMVRTTVAGQVTDEAGDPLEGVTVTVNGNTTVTGASGVFMLTGIDVTSKRFFAILTKAGYIKQFYGTYPFENEVTYIKAMMMKAEGTLTLNASLGGTVALPDGSSAEFPANALIYSNQLPYTGTATVVMNYMNADDSNFVKKIPGRDLRAVNATGQEKSLVSYGMMSIELYGSSGEKLLLAPGKNATLSFPIASMQFSNAPPVMPAWYFDEVIGKWREEGIALRNGTIYKAEVSHFSWWNVDIPYDLAFIKGKVKSCSGNSMSNINVLVNYSLPGYVTNNEGDYAGDAPAGFGPFEVVGESPSYTYTQPETIPNLSAGQIYTVNDLIFDATTSATLTITGTITNCDGYPTYGLVVLSDAQGNFIQHQYVSQGTFTFTAQNNSAYTIAASAGINSGSITLPFNPNFNCPSVDIGSIQMCAASTGSQFTASIISAEFGVQSIAIDVDHCAVTIDSVLQQTEIVINDYDTINAGFTTMNMKVSDYLPGNYDWNSTTNSLTFSGTINGIAVSVASDLSSTGGNSIVTAAPAGGFLKAAFSGPVIISSPLLPSPVTGYMSGDFEVYRNQ